MKANTQLKVKFLRLISTLKKAEIDTFQDFLRVPNPEIKRQKSCSTLLKELLKKSVVETNLYGESIYKFSDEMVNDLSKSDSNTAVQRKIKSNTTYLSYLHKALIIYVGQYLSLDLPRDILHKNYMTDVLYLEFLQKRNLTDDFTNYFNRFQIKLKKEKKSEHLYYVQKIAEQLNINNQILTKKPTQKIDASNRFRWTTKYNMLTILKVACSQENINMNRGISEETDVSKINNLLINKLPEDVKNFEDDELIQLYYAVYKIFKDSASINEIGQLIHSIPRYEESIAYNELYNIYKLIESICLEKTRKGVDSHFRTLIFNVYKHLNDLNLLVRKNFITNKLFLNTVNEAAKTQNFEWGHQFIEKYKERLPIQEKTNISQLAKSLLLFESRAYQSAIDILSDHRLFFKNDPKIENNKIILLCKSLYEIKEFDTLRIRIQKHRNDLTKNKKLTDSFKTQIKGFLNILNTLYKVQYNFKYKNLTKDNFIEKVKKIELELESTETKVDNQDWLLEKTKELISS